MATVQINDFTITEFVNFEAYMRDTGMLDFRLEELQDFTVDATQDKTELKGKNGRVIGYKKQNKKLTGKGTYGMISAGLMKTQTGGDMVSGKHKVKKSELKVVSGTTLITDAVATGTEGSEIGYIKELAANGAVTNVYEQSTVADETHFAYSATTKTITLPVKASKGVIADGTKVVYAYEREVEATKITNPSDKFSEVREVWVHCFGTDACDNEYYIAIRIPRADFSGEFSINIGGDQTVQNFSFDAMADLCNPVGDGADLFDVIIYTDATSA